MSNEQTGFNGMMHQVVCPYHYDTERTFYVGYPDTVPTTKTVECPTCDGEFTLDYEPNGEKVDVDIQTHDDE